MVLAFVLLSEFTKAWLLYLGLIFLFMVMYAPGGIASLVMMNLRVAKFGKLGRLGSSYLALGATALLALAGGGAMVEMLYHQQLNAALGPELRFLGMTLNTTSVSCWFASFLVLVTGGALFERGAPTIQPRLAPDPGRDRTRNPAEGRPVSATPLQTPALELRDLRKSFGKSEIIRGVNLAVQPGERVAIIGPMAPANPRCST